MDRHSRCKVSSAKTSRLQREKVDHLERIDIVHCSFDFPLADKLQLEVLHHEDQYPPLHAHETLRDSQQT